MRLRSKSLGIIPVAVVCCAFFREAPDAERRPYYFGRTTDPTPVEVTLQDRDQLIRFKIPKVYMTFSDNWKGGVQNFIALETIFPSMAPLSATRSSSRGTDVVAIDLHSYAYTGADNNVSRILEWEMGTQWTLMDRIADQSGQEYLVYVRKGDENKRFMPNMMVTEFLVPDRGGDQPDIYFDCLREEGNPAVGCIANSNFGRNLSLEFIFRRTELRHWPEIRDAVMSLLNGFKQEPER